MHYIQVRDRCHGRAARTRREELIMACCRHARTRRRSGVAGHMAQGGRLRAIAWARATYRRCRSWNAAARRALCPLCRSLAMHGTWTDGTAGSMCRVAPIICAADPHFFSASKFHELLMPDPSQTSGYVGTCPTRQRGLVGGHAGPTENGAL